MLIASGDKKEQCRNLEFSVCSVSLLPEVCRSIGEVEVSMLNVALSRVRAPKVISGCR